MWIILAQGKKNHDPPLRFLSTKLCQHESSFRLQSSLYLGEIYEKNIIEMCLHIISLRPYLETIHQTPFSKQDHSPFQSRILYCILVPTLILSLPSSTSIQVIWTELVTDVINTRISERLCKDICKKIGEDWFGRLQSQLNRNKLKICQKLIQNIWVISKSRDDKY